MDLTGSSRLTLGKTLMARATVIAGRSFTTFIRMCYHNDVFLGDNLRHFIGPILRSCSLISHGGEESTIT